MLPFGTVFIELFFILSNLWQHQVYYMFGFLFVVFLILVVTCAEITTVMCYFQLCAENYHWWWRSFLTSGPSPRKMEWRCGWEMRPAHWFAVPAFATRTVCSSPRWRSSCGACRLVRLVPVRVLHFLLCDPAYGHPLRLGPALLRVHDHGVASLLPADGQHRLCRVLCLRAPHLLCHQNRLSATASACRSAASPLLHSPLPLASSPAPTPPNAPLPSRCWPGRWTSGVSRALSILTPPTAESLSFICPMMFVACAPCLSQGSGVGVVAHGTIDRGVVLTQQPSRNRQ